MATPVPEALVTLVRAAVRVPVPEVPHTLVRAARMPVPEVLRTLVRAAARMPVRAQIRQIDAELGKAPTWLEVRLTHRWREVDSNPPSPHLCDNHTMPPRLPVCSPTMRLHVIVASHQAKTRQS
jgi:hypothetical protein